MSKYSENFKVPQLKRTLEHRTLKEKRSRCLRRQNAFDGTRVMSQSPEAQQHKSKGELRLERLQEWKQLKQQKMEAEKKNKKPDWKFIKHRFSTIGEQPNKSTSSQQPSLPHSKHSYKSTKSFPINSKKTKNQSNVAPKKPEILVEYVPTPSTPSTKNHYPLTTDHEFRAPFTQKRIDQILRQSFPITPTNMVTRAKKNKHGADELPDISYNIFSSIENDRNIGITSTPSIAATTSTNMGMFVVTPVKMPLKPSTSESRRPSGGALFEDLLEVEIERLNSICSDWESILTENAADIPSQILDEIEATIGQTKLLISKKFEQFRKLTYGIGPKKIESEDLQGFWDMMYIQVTGLDTRFVNLNNLKNNNWIEEVPVVVKKNRKTKKTNNVKAVGASAGIKAAIAAAKKKMEEENRKKDELGTSIERSNFAEKSTKKNSFSEEKRQTRPRRTNVFASMLRAKKEQNSGNSSEK